MCYPVERQITDIHIGVAFSQKLVFGIGCKNFYITIAWQQKKLEAYPFAIVDLRPSNI